MIIPKFSIAMRKAKMYLRSAKKNSPMPITKLNLGRNGLGNLTGNWSQSMKFYSNIQSRFLQRIRMRKIHKCLKVIWQRGEINCYIFRLKRLFNSFVSFLTGVQLGATEYCYHRQLKSFWMTLITTPMELLERRSAWETIRCVKFIGKLS